MKYERLADKLVFLSNPVVVWMSYVWNYVSNMEMSWFKASGINTMYTIIWYADSPANWHVSYNKYMLWKSYLLVCKTALVPAVADPQHVMINMSYRSIVLDVYNYNTDQWLFTTFMAQWRITWNIIIWQWISLQ